MKKKLAGINVLYPTPTTIVGAMVAGKPNFITIAHVGIVNHARPYLISLSSGKTHYTNTGIKENKAFSVNIPDYNEAELLKFVNQEKVGLLKAHNPEDLLNFIKWASTEATLSSSRSKSKDLSDEGTNVALSPPPPSITSSTEPF